jgi:L-2,4-diaminobutyric acid acetyltransferase
MSASPRTAHERGPGSDSPSIAVRPPRVEDGAAMWRLVRDLPDLEENSLYAYLLFGRDFARTSRVAVQDGDVVGMVAGYRPPADPDTLFVWQVGVHPRAQRRGLAARMILDILDAGEAPPLRYLEATVARGNVASARLFEGIARRANTECTVAEGFEARHFQPQEHQPESRFRIGPFRRTP